VASRPASRRLLPRNMCTHRLLPEYATLSLVGRSGARAHLRGSFSSPQQVAQAVESARSAPPMALPPDPNSVDGPPLDLLRRRLFYLDLLRKRVMGERGSWTGKPLRRGRRVERFVGRHGGSIGRNKKGRGTRPVGPTLRCGTHGQTSQTTLKTGQGPNEIDR
jgi:hypothetical protein